MPFCIIIFKLRFELKEKKITINVVYYYFDRNRIILGSLLLKEMLLLLNCSEESY